MVISIPALTAAALTNGLNPCGIGMTITFLGYLMVFGGGSGDRKRLIKTGAVYIFSVFLTYLLAGLLFYGLAFFMQKLWLATIFKYLMGGVIMAAGLIQVKDVFFPDSPIHLRMGMGSFSRLSALMEKATLPVTFLIGFLTTAFSTPCMMPLYVGTATVLARSGLPPVSVLLYFVYYNLVFILPLLMIWILMIGGKRVVEMKEMEHRFGRWGRLAMGIAMVIAAFFILR